MRRILGSLGRQLRLILIFVLIMLVAATIWKLFTYQDIVIEDYRLLASIPAEEIIDFQMNEDETWKDYVAVSQAIRDHHDAENNNQDSKAIILEKIQTQLDRNIKFQNLNWSGVDSSIKKTARNYRKILDKYPVYIYGKYTFPLKKTCYYIDTYGADREGGKRLHQGTDLFDKKGTEIFTVCNGTIEKLGWNRLGGERVGVRGEDGNYYYYAHLDTINKDLWVGKKISQGKLIGTMGNTGDAITTPDHLHFGIELPSGEWLNPYVLLKVWEYHKFDSVKID